MKRTLRSLIFSITIFFLVVGGVMALEEFNIDVRSTYSVVTFNIADPRPLQTLTTATFVTREGFETPAGVEWKQDETSPGYYWTVETPDNGVETIDEIYFNSDIFIKWTFTGPWTVNAEGNGIVRGKISTLLPYISAN